MKKTTIKVAALLVFSALCVCAQTGPKAAPVAAAASERSGASSQKPGSAGPKGTVPSASASNYPAHETNDGAALGAKLLTADEARKALRSDVNRCCVVVEVAVYPGANQATNLSLNDFVLRVKSTDNAAKPSSAGLIAAGLQKKAHDQRDVQVSPHGSVGYGTSYDPIYGPATGVTTTAIIGVGVSGRGTQPGSTDKDRTTMETELSEKGLPEGSAITPVAGYLYFYLPRDKHAIYQLEHVLSGQKVLLTLN
jgi:hypothetical protein